MNKKRIIFMRHGSIFNHDDEYENMKYYAFMTLLLKLKNPPLMRNNKKKNYLKRSDEYVQLQNAEIDTSLKDIDAIFPSPSRRTMETANLLKAYFQDKPTIVRKNRELLAEVKFSSDILEEKLFEEKGGWKGCRNILLKRWFDGENIESFQNSFTRIKELDEYIRNTRFSNVLVITHGIFLRMIYMYYHDQLKVNDSGELIRDEETLKNLFDAPRLKYGGYYEFNFNGSVEIIETGSELNLIKTNAEKSDEKKVIKPLSALDKNGLNVILNKGFQLITTRSPLLLKNFLNSFV